MTRWMIGVAIGLLLPAIGGPGTAAAQAPSVNAAVADSSTLKAELALDSASQSVPSGVHHQRKVTRQLGELEPVLEWQWGAIAATALAMAGAILLTLPVALVYMWTRPPDEYDPSVIHSSIMLAPTIAGILIVIQGSLAMAFSLAGVATAVRFRNSVKDTNDAVYVFVAVAIGLAAGGQALDIALAISTIFSAVVLLLSKSPFRITGNPQHPAHGHHRRRQADPVEASSGYLIRGKDLGQVRGSIEACLERGTKHWAWVNESRDVDGQVTLRYSARYRKRYPPELLLRELNSLARSPAFTVEAAPALPNGVTVGSVTPIASGARA